MSISSEDDLDHLGPIPGSKKRRLPRACDNCRKRKTKCDSSQTLSGKCTSCVTLGTECEHTLPVKKRGPQKKRTYVDDLEDKVRMLEDVIRKYKPDVDIAEELANITLSSSSNNVQQTGRTSVSGSPLAAVYGATPPSDNTADEEEDKEERDQTALNMKLKQLNIAMSDHGGFMGQSSAFMLMRSALTFKEALLRKTTPASFDAYIRRPKFWQLEPWEMDRLQADDDYPQLEFPEPDLFNHLVGQYFARAHCVVPIVHRPTFERHLREGLHLRDRGFGLAILAICAVASRFSKDPRVYVPGTSNDALSRGWKWFSQIQQLPSPNLFRMATLHEVQCYAICVTYLVGTSSPHAAWNLMGIALRLCVQLGIHRKSSQPRTVESESWKRVFWSLIAMDGTVSSFVGRPCAVSRDDIDCEYPVECDDEYWDTGDPETSWKQPVGKPSLATCSIVNLRLLEILTYALKNLYCTPRSKATTGHVGLKWEKEMAAELDTAMNRWIDELPEHLRWDPTTKDNIQFFQASLLYCTYYHVQIQIHRPFIIKSSPLTFPSLAICSNAARSCARLLEVQVKRNQVLPIPQLNVSAFIAGVVLLMNLWAGPKTGLVLDPPRELQDVEGCMSYLRACESFTHISGRFHDLLAELASLRDGPFPEFPATAPSAARKRTRGDFEQAKERRGSAPSQVAPSSSAPSMQEPSVPSLPPMLMQSAPASDLPSIMGAGQGLRSEYGMQPLWQDSFTRQSGFHAQDNFHHDSYQGDPMLSQVAQQQRLSQQQQFLASTSHTPRNSFNSRSSSRRSFSGVSSGDMFLQSSYPPGIPYEQTYESEQGPSRHAYLARDDRSAAYNNAGPFSFPQYPINMESDFDMPSMEDYEAAMQDPTLLQGNILDGPAHGVFALGTNMMSMCDTAPGTFDSAEWSQYLGLMAQDPRHSQHARRAQQPPMHGLDLDPYRGNSGYSMQ
ncbi:fungal-specific transcription factor domain-containing protein [Schizophyllum amplum]|uniref:Fungal-specific transcription factor domain-containing protein n=1 Tax=Schizophyllum amplum TaxID=97359 RepID=A0A550CXA7_9AGAR|nr:fungal-specific transcription factor domain-containing protein [Auriculariopsis ampla]